MTMTVSNETTPQSENKLCKDAIKPATAELKINDVLYLSETNMATTQFPP